MTDTPTVLFVCVHNAGRSQMAAGWLRHLGGDRVRVLSLTDADLDRMVASGSREAIKFLLNLSRVLGRRLLALRALLGPVGV